MRLRIACSALIATGLCLGVLPAPEAARISDVAGTVHNLSASGPGPVKASSESQICVFCHTPHAAENVPGAPLWNRQLSGATYTPYTSESIDADDIAASPGGSSKLCLSCHDGTLAIGAVNVANGASGVTFPMQGTEADGTIPGGSSGADSGFTRRLGVDLRNDHPVSFTYDSALASADGELRDPAVSAHIATRGPGVRPPVPLENGKLECSSCHDPHIRDDALAYSIKFLRLNRFQVTPPAGGSFNEAGDIVCLACHDKLGTAWSQSAHADSAVADEVYRNAPAGLREFFPGIRVWEASCLNCHDAHTVPGARRLLREGTDALGLPKQGGGSALEETCYQCHTSSAESILSNTTQVPDLRTEFDRDHRMPIRSADQAAFDEIHDPFNADGEETRSRLGQGNLNNRHAECTDCHNPHRVMRNRLFNGTGDSIAGTHAHDTTPHSNIASGVLRGAWGVEPIYPLSASFQLIPANTDYQVKRGDPGTGASTEVSQPYVTREYQICLKCHSNFSYDDDNQFPVGSRPDLGSFIGGTDPGTNNLTQYTNQAKEFRAPITHKGEVSRSDTGAGNAYGTNNHRSWHPVMDSTGRSAAIRNMNASTNLFLAPWNGASIGVQTMFCSDCHGATTANGTVEPPGGENGTAWGPHGSSNAFILKGQWSSSTGDDGSGLCFRCHNHTNYATEENEGDREGFESGFSGPRDSNLHALHAKRVGRNLRCSWCHAAVPHGWKNKALLVNLNDVGPEAGLSPGTEIAADSPGDFYNKEPYYLDAKLKIRTFATSGNWQDANCGSAGANIPGNDTQTGKDWMQDVCRNIP